MLMRQINKDTVYVHVPRGLSFSSDPVPGASTQSASTWQHIIMKFALANSDETRQDADHRTKNVIHTPALAAILIQ